MLNTPLPRARSQLTTWKKKRTLKTGFSCPLYPPWWLEYSGPWPWNWPWPIWEINLWFQAASGSGSGSGSIWNWLPCHFLGPGVLNFLGGGRGCAGALTRPSTRHLPPKNFEKTALRKRGGIFTVKMRGGHNYGNYCNTLFGSQLSTTCNAHFLVPDSQPHITTIWAVSRVFNAVTMYM